MTNVDYRRVIEIRKMMASKKSVIRGYQEIPGIGPSEKPTKWLYYFLEKYLFIEGGIHESGSHMRKTAQEAESLLRQYTSDMMVTAVKMGSEDMVVPEIMKGRDGLKILEVKSLKALSDQIFTDTAVRIPITELE